MRIAVEVPDSEVWSQVFGSAFDAYPWWRHVHFHNGASWEVPGTVTLTIDDPDEPEGTAGCVMALVDVRMLEEAINKALGQDMIPNDVEAWDSADYADTILQIAVLGDVYYG